MSSMYGMGHPLQEERENLICKDNLAVVACKDKHIFPVCSFNKQPECFGYSIHFLVKIGNGNLIPYNSSEHGDLYITPIATIIREQRRIVHYPTGIQIDGFNVKQEWKVRAINIDNKDGLSPLLNYHNLEMRLLTTNENYQPTFTHLQNVPPPSQHSKAIITLLVALYYSLYLINHSVA